jgi:hypothetical protein
VVLEASTWSRNNSSRTVQNISFKRKKRYPDFKSHEGRIPAIITKSPRKYMSKNQLESGRGL